MNDAVTLLVTRRKWKWRISALSLALTISQSYVALPTDFTELVSLRSGTSPARNIIPATEDQIATYRQTNGSSGGDIYYFVSWTTQASVTASPIARLEIFPTPAASESAGALQGFYLRQTAKMANSTDLPDMPPFMFPALKQFVRGYAMQQEQQEGWESEMARAESMIEMAERTDSGAQNNHGTMRRVVVSPSSMSETDAVRFFPFSGISGP